MKELLMIIIILIFKN